jgi:hypothetical protein
VDTHYDTSDFCFEALTSAGVIRIFMPKVFVVEKCLGMVGPTNLFMNFLMAKPAAQWFWYSSCCVKLRLRLRLPHLPVGGSHRSLSNAGWQFGFSAAIVAQKITKISNKMQ